MPRRKKKWLRKIYLLAMSAMPLRARVIFGYAVHHRAWPRIDRPRSFNEKIIWRKLYERNPRMVVMADKVKAKEWVAARYGERFIIPTLAVYAMPEEMDFGKPPLSKPPYVIKTNHDSASNIYIRCAADHADAAALRRRLARQLANDFGRLRGEWCYSQIERRILVEPYIETPEGYLADYKFHVFSGRTKMVEAVFDRYGDIRGQFVDRDWQPLDLTWTSRPPESPVPPPANFGEMLEFAESLAQEFSYARVDLYNVGGQTKFGEMTFYPGAGHDPFVPVEWDYRLGEAWVLPEREYGQSK